MNDNIKLSGRINLLLKDKYSRVKDERNISNTITSVGKAELSSFIAADVGGTGFDYIAIGVGTPSATVLGSESTTNGGSRRGGADVTGTQTTTTTANDTAQLATTFTFTGTLVITEAGIFNASSAGTMLASQSFSALNVVSTDTLQITWKVKVA